MTWLNIAAIVDATQAEGPGIRTAIWVQGCLKRCPSCCNPEFLKIKPTNLIEVEQLKQQINTNKQQFNIEGITLLGGEPVLQAQGLAELAQYAHSIDLTVMLFTGYKSQELDEHQFKGINKLLKFTDVVVDGEFEIDVVEQKRNWVGSDNQKFHYITNKYDSSIELMPDTTTNEWRINDKGQVSANGLPFIVKL